MLFFFFFFFFCFVFVLWLGELASGCSRCHQERLLLFRVDDVVLPGHLSELRVVTDARDKLDVARLQPVCVAHGSCMA